MSHAASDLITRAWHTALVHSGVRSVANRLRHGPDAPRPNTRITFTPSELTNRYHRAKNDNMRIGHWQTGQILDGDWDLATRPFRSSLKFQSCLKHFHDGTPWDQTRAMTYGFEKIASQGKYDACRTKADLVARYARLDDLWDKTKSAGALPAPLSETANARTGILVHIDRNGAPLFGNQGFHRLAIAQLADIPQITCVIGVVHPQAVSSGSFTTLLNR
ncbi:hypothetical protein FHS72_002432 [Loktanella ponticola]|uniref:Uncharacterized protein n=1 Tax=Yoonia ponticola TaxID=1524255 RepID=A0A7W9BLL8_9RHOB|nr:hypothetical protein [Yoonia ponticola]MBB5722802.1 hypothetical protein [Yoonia ponticola]